ncbi:23S rRNA (uracil(1939)-C(5))-methyltransferase RlmD [Pasteurellaceae bacterium LIM206]|nr:23S rRNA (uracil(1939)-C(5))-methyltransferase RlmD [Pasteurellaceae bacterium LIM206]
MVLLYTPGKKQATRSVGVTADILELDYQGLGVARIQGKTWFIENALPGERVQCSVTEEKRQYGLAKAQKILMTSRRRQTPKCKDYTQCGGCQSQHIPLDMQRSAKQQALFRRLTKLQPSGIEFMPMIAGGQWGYRRRARLSMLFNVKSKRLDIGFRQKRSARIVNISHCDVIEPALNNLLPHLNTLFRRFSQPKQLGHIELVRADNTIAMLLRYSGNLKASDCFLLDDFCRRQHISLFLQDDEQLSHVMGELPYYRLMDNLCLQFDVRDFIQINRELNQHMVTTALDWLELKKEDHVLDLFCGMGNFTLPLSLRVQSAVGIEGVLSMVEKARGNAERNNCRNVQFYQADLDKSFVEQPWSTQRFNKILLDPPRTGAAFALTALCELQAEKILYVSCNPATLVRDAEILLRAGYRVEKVAMIDMFPNTGHLESITLFSK